MSNTIIIPTIKVIIECPMSSRQTKLSTINLIPSTAHNVNSVLCR